MIGLFFLLALLALLCVLAPALWSRQPSATPAQSNAAEASRAWYQQRLDALAEEDLEQSQRAELADELGAVLLAEYPQEPAGADTRAVEDKPNTVKPANLLLGLGVLLVGLAAALYAALGSYGATKIQGAQAILGLSGEQSSDELRRWQGRLGQWLTSQPDDAQSWYLLGHAHLKLGEFSLAAAAFEQAHEYADGDVSVKFYWLQARYLERQGVLDERSRQLADDILAADPNNPQVLEMLAVAAISDGDAGAAITMLNRTLNSEQRPERVRATVDAIAALRSAYAQQADNLDVQIKVVVEAEAAPMAGIVFVVARPVGGGMPYAVARRPSWLLPFAVTLDDLVSMSGNRPLSQAAEVEVLVRLSASGLAQAEAGDWTWLSQPLSLKSADKPVELQAQLTPPS